jgi:hypothetical protein
MNVRLVGNCMPEATTPPDCEGSEPIPLSVDAQGKLVIRSAKYTAEDGLVDVPLKVKTATGDHVDVSGSSVSCSTGSPPGPCAGGGGSSSGGSGETTPVNAWSQCKDPATGSAVACQVDLIGGSADRLDLAWWGAWAAVGVLLALLVVPRLLARFRFGHDF